VDRRAARFLCRGALAPASSTRRAPQTMSRKKLKGFDQGMGTSIDTACVRYAKREAARYTLPLSISLTRALVAVPSMRDRLIVCQCIHAVGDVIQ
jgi:hypothetical protein